MTAPLPSSWLTDLVRRRFPAGTALDPVSFRESLEGRLTDVRKARGKRHPLPSLVSVLVAGVAAACPGPLAVAALALDPAIPAAYAAHRAEQQREQEERQKKRKRKPPAAAAFREERQDGWFRPHPAHPWLDPAVTGDPGHVPARQGVAVDGKERKGAKAGGNRKVHLLAAVTHVPGLVIA